MRELYEVSTKFKLIVDQSCIFSKQRHNDRKSFTLSLFMAPIQTEKDFMAYTRKKYVPVLKSFILFN